MSFLDALRDNPDAAVTAATTVLGWLGFSQWRKKRAATAAEVDRWATVAVAVIVVAIKNGVFNDNAAAINAFLTRFRKLLTAAGVEVKPEHEARAMLIAQEKIAQAIDVLSAADAARLGAVSDAILADLDRWFPPKKKAATG